MTIQAKPANRTADSGVVYGVSSANNDVAVPLAVSNTGSIIVTTDSADSNGSGTRSYNLGAATRTTVNATSSAPVQIGTMGPSREVMFVASTRCFVKFGANNVNAAAATDTDVLPLPQDTMFHLRVPNGVTHFRVIRDSADGFIRCIPVI